jgi:hypothetical protein
MLKGKVTLSLLMGPVVPVPVPKGIVDALTDVTITTTSGEASGFQLTFAFNSNLLLNALLLLLGQVGPFIRVIIVANLKGTQEVLMDGVIVNQQNTPNLQAGTSVLTITGTDLTSVMKLIDFTGIPYPAMPAEARVALIIAKYAMFGMIPIVIPILFIDVPIPTSRIPIHQGTDLEYVKKLAHDVGYVFYITPGPVPGTNKAYWGPEIKVGVPQPALNVDMDGLKNVTSLNFNFDGGSGTIPIVYIQNEQTKAPIPIPIPGIGPLNPPLGIIPPFPSNFPKMRNTANLNPVQAISQGLAEASRKADAVTGTGSLNVVKYGHILKARGLVGVRGVGEAFNGLYYVKSVTHRLKAGEYTQDFTLIRNGLVSTLPRIPV